MIALRFPLARFAVTALLALAAAAASAQISFTVEGGRPDAQPIAVVPFAFAGGGAPPEDVAQIITDDLARSGFFQPVARRNLPSRPSDPSQIVFSDWRILGTAHVVIGQIKPIPGGKYQVAFRLMDAFKGTQSRF